MALNEAGDVAQGVDAKNSTNVELDQLSTVKALLLSHEELPSQEQVENQEKLFGAFSQLILGPSCKVRTFGNNGTLYGYQSFSEERHLLLVRVGSHGFGTWKPTDPMSCVCFGSISKSSFFSLAEHRLESAEGDEKIIILKKSTDPENEINEMFHVSWRGLRIGLHFCFLAPYGMSRWDGLLYNTAEEPTLSSDTMRALNACKDIRYIHDSVQNLEKFKIVYHLVHLWACYRGIYSEQLGYLSREQILLLLNHLWKTRHCEEKPLSSILNTFFAYYSQLDWDKDVIIDPEHGTKDIIDLYSRHRTPVFICNLFPPWRNAASLITKNSLKLILREFTRAANLTGNSEVDWQGLLGLHGLPEQKDTFSFAGAQFVQRFSVFVRFEMRYWGSNVASRVHFLNLMGTHFASLSRKLIESNFRYSLARSGSLAFAWPHRLRDRPKNAESEEFFYLIGIEYNGAPEDLDPSKNSIRSECDTLVESMCREGIFDPTTGWVSISVVGREEIAEVFSDGEGVPGESDKYFVPDSVGKSSPLENIEKGTGNEAVKDPVKNDAPKKLRPAADVLNRLTWDHEFDRKDYIVGYDDRFSGALEIPLDSWKGDPTDEDFIPQHRILYFKRKSTNDIIWDRRKKVDKIFGTANQSDSQ